VGKVFSLFSVAAALSAASLTVAAAQVVTTTGTIKAVDMLKHTVTLANGSTYKMARGVSLEGMKAGQKVTLTFRRSGPTPDLELSTIAPAED